MKNIKNFLYAVVCLMTLGLQTDASAKRMGGAIQPVQLVTEIETIATKNVSEAALAAQAIKLEAQDTIDDAQQQLEMGEITHAQAAKIIGENKFMISQVEERLAGVVEDEIVNVAAAEAEQGRLDWFLSGVRGLGQGAISLARAGKIYSEEEKAIARAIVEELQIQMKDLKDNYIQDVKNASASEKALLTTQYEQEKQELENALSEQNVILGEAMSSGMQKFWGVVGVAGAITGGLLLKKYLDANKLEQQLAVQKDLEIAADTQAADAIKLQEQLSAREDQEIKEGKPVRALYDFLNSKLENTNPEAQEGTSDTTGNQDKIEETQDLVLEKPDAGSNQQDGQNLGGEIQSPPFFQNAQENAELPEVTPISNQDVQKLEPSEIIVLEKDEGTNQEPIARETDSDENKTEEPEGDMSGNNLQSVLQPINQAEASGGSSVEVSDVGKKLDQNEEGEKDQQPPSDQNGRNENKENEKKVEEENPLQSDNDGIKPDEKENKDDNEKSGSNSAPTPLYSNGGVSAQELQAMTPAERRLVQKEMVGKLVQGLGASTAAYMLSEGMPLTVMSALLPAGRFMIPHPVITVAGTGATLLYQAYRNYQKLNAK